MKKGSSLARACVLTLVLMLALLGTAAAESQTKQYKRIGIAVTFDTALEEKGFQLYSSYYDDHYNAYLRFSCIDPAIYEAICEAGDLAEANDDMDALWAVMEQYLAHLNVIAEIYAMDRTDHDAYQAEGKMPIDTADMTSLGEHNGYLYWVKFYNLDFDSLGETQSEAEIAACQEVMAALGDLSGIIAYIPVTRMEAIEAGDKFPAFVGSDMQGSEVTEAIFAEKELTVVNFWATTCGPCISEMPELGEWARELPENVQIIGVLTDVWPDQQQKIDMVNQIMRKANADFINLMTNDVLYAYYKEHMIGTPTTILVNSRGEVVGNTILGTAIEQYKQEVEAYFNGQ
ncbi:MAG: TlpA family protein disulfide reductase [Aristaeellaceae bacterium]